MISTSAFASSGSSFSPAVSPSASACSPSAPASCPISSASPGDRDTDGIARLVGDYHAFERALRAVYAAGGRLAVSAAETHAELDLGGLAGHQVLAAIATAQAHLGGAIGEAAGGHRQLEALGRRLGLDVTAYGDGQKPPPALLALPTDAAPRAALA